MFDIHFYCEAVGGLQHSDEDPARRCTGPMVVALNLFFALSRFSKLNFCFFTLAPSVISHPRIQLLREWNPAKVHQVLFGLDLAEMVLARAAGAPVILGPNVLFNLPHGDERYSELDPESRRTVDRETALCQTSALFLFPSLYEDSLMRRRLPQKQFVAFPSGIDTELFAPADSAKPVDIAIMPKGRYSDRETYSLALDLAEKLHAAIRNDYQTELITDYDRRDYPQLLSQWKAVVNTTPWETQGLAIMEAQAAGVPVIHRTGLPYQPESLRICQRDYTVEDFKRAIPLALADRAQLSALSRAHIMENFSLKTMAKQYEQIVGNLL